MELKKIIIPEEFKLTPPASWKLQRVEDYYQQYKALPGKITVSYTGVLLDGYTIYRVARAHSIGQVPVRIRSVEIIEGVHKYGGKAYAWRVPEDLRGAIQQGDRCLVSTQHGFRVVTVRNMRYQLSSGYLRPVVKIIR